MRNRVVGAHWNATSVKVPSPLLRNRALAPRSRWRRGRPGRRRGQVAQQRPSVRPPSRTPADSVTSRNRRPPSLCRANSLAIAGKEIGGRQVLPRVEVSAQVEVDLAVVVVSAADAVATRTRQVAVSVTSVGAVAIVAEQVVEARAAANSSRSPSLSRSTGYVDRPQVAGRPAAVVVLERAVAVVPVEPQVRRRRRRCRTSRHCHSRRRPPRPWSTS